jgi:NADPH:quinone reductase-like Zn-dependent oxidoreductase
MKAVQALGIGDVSVLNFMEIERPQPTARDVLVRVKASGLNPIEWKIRSGAMAGALGRGMPVTFGWACAGIVETVGSEATAFKVGDEVYSHPEFARGGTHAEYVVINEAQVARKPTCLSFVQAAAVPTTAQAASMILKEANVSAGERVLIHGGAGEVGHWLIQMAIAAGADVIATASGAGLQAVMDLGASKAIDSCTGQIEEVGQVDVVFNLIGSDTQGRSWALHGIGGRLSSIKKSSDTEQVDAIKATAKFVFTPPNGAALSAMTEQFQRGALKPLKVAHEFALSDAGEAHEIGETGKSCGKMVLIP